MSNACQELRDRLHAYRAGELSPLWRTRIEQHLAGCRSCAAEWLMVSEVENAAKVGPEPLADARKRSILDAVHAEIQPETQPSRPARRWWPRIVVPSLATAAAAGILLVVLSGEPIREPRSGWVAQSSGVQAFAPQPARTRLVSEDNRPELRIEQGTVVVRFQRPPGSEPLRVATPHATAVVRGTVFSVDASGNATTICVERGHVEVHTERRVAMLEAGQQITARESGSQRAHCGEQRTALMRDTFHLDPPTAAPEPEPIPEPAARALPESTPEPQKTVVVTEPPEPEPELPAAGFIIERARARWRAGDTTVALAELEALMARDLEDAERAEALYLTATIHRARDQFALAAVLLEEVTTLGAEPVARLARFERAHILARDLGDRAGALTQLDALLAGASNDTIADEASFERCALLLEDRELSRARACLRRHLERFPDSGRQREAARLQSELGE